MKESMWHLARRALTSINNSALSEEEVLQVLPWLNDAERDVWLSMPPRDCRHSLQVHARFESLCPAATKEEHAAALLHDVGKISSGLGWMLRVVATIVGPRGARFSRYHNHGAIGGEMLAGKSTTRTIDLVAEKVNDEVSRALYAADNI